MEKSVELIAGILKQPVDQVSELLSSDEGVQKIEEQINGLKVHTQDEFLSVVNNLQTAYKDKAYGDTKAAVLEQLEKNLQAEFGSEFKRGEDYNSAVELVKKINAIKADQGGDDSELKKEITTLQELLQNNKKSSDDAIKELNTQRDSEISDYILKGKLKAVKRDIDLDGDVLDGQVELFEMKFKQLYQTRKNDDGSYIVWDIAKEEVVKNDDFSYATVDQVVDKVAPSYLPFKDVTKSKGRGSEFKKEVKQQTTTTINWGKYDNNFDNYYNAVLKGKGIGYGSQEMNEVFRQFQKEVG